jgi:uncharacterized protein
MNRSNREYQLLVKPVSSDCNMGCDYCFYARKDGMFSPRGAPMADDVLEEMIRQYLGERFSISVFGWQGGEPTLAGLPFFRKVIAFQQRHGVGQQLVGNGLQTNGLLVDREWAEFLAEYRFLVGLSIDGPRDLHDSQRRTLGGGETFEGAMDAAREMRRVGVSFNILSVVSRAGEGRGKEVYRWARGEGFDHLQFIPCVEVDPETGEVAEFSVTPEGYGRFLCDVFEEWRQDEYPDVSVRLFDSLLAYYAEGEQQICELAPDRCGNCLVVERTAEVFPCDFFVQPEWRLGNLKEKSLSLLARGAGVERFRGMRQVLPDECLDCEWLRMCWGGCMKDRLTAGPIEGGRSYLCEGYRMFFGETSSELGRIARETAPTQGTAERR